MSKQKWLLENTLKNLIGDAELVLREVEDGVIPSRDLQGTFKVNCEVSLKTLANLREEDL